MSTNRLSRLHQNPITGFGIFLTTLSALLFLLFFFVDIFGVHRNPYLGILFFLVLPVFFLIGLILIPVGMWRERSRRLHGLAPSEWHYPRIDLNNPRHARATATVLILSIVNIIILLMAAYRGIEYMDSAAFCGKVCHTVMSPEYTAYQDGPHARVMCVECHIGEGASWFVRSKIDGIRQVWAVTFNTYSKPIPSPVHNLRPARETCEHCHWPEKFTGDLVRRMPLYGDDEANSDQSTTLQVRVGGGGARFGGPQGIHWHTSRNHKVEYIAADEARETIAMVRLTDANGQVTEYVADGADEAALRQKEWRTMDCVDCHNRPSHKFQPTPEKAVDTAIEAGFIPANLPYIRREAVAALRDSFPDHAAAERGIKARVEKFYQDNYPDLVQAGDGRIAQAVGGVQRVYTHNVFPWMNLNWGTHPNHIGHETSPGCFRCHDEMHHSKDGKTISQDCELCHKMME